MAPTMLNLQGKHALIFGVASEESIAWAIAKKLHQAGAQISLGYQQRFKSRILQLVRSGEVPVRYYERCDVTNADEMANFFANLPAPVDVLAHCIAYTNPSTFAKRISEVTQDEFVQALTASSYSLIPLVHAAAPKMPQGGSVMTLTYLGGQRVVANYKLMGIAKAALEHTVRELATDVGPQGIRVNAISAGPIRTLAASQISGFDAMMKVYETVAPLRRGVSQDDVGDLATFLASDMARNITGQVVFVDARLQHFGHGGATGSVGAVDTLSCCASLHRARATRQHGTGSLASGAGDASAVDHTGDFFGTVAAFDAFQHANRTLGPALLADPQVVVGAGGYGCQMGNGNGLVTARYGLDFAANAIGCFAPQAGVHFIEHVHRY